jgi:mannose-6-phosphate isomerase-like protein (cupin superfamily)
LDRVEPTTIPRLRFTPDDARRAPIPEGQLSALVMAHGSMELRWYAPQGHDPQQPHDRDELYVIVSGTGVFLRGEVQDPFDDLALPLHGEERVTIQPGDTLFVPAGTRHHFEATSPDFGAWVIFYGPEGGEA